MLVCPKTNFPNLYSSCSRLSIDIRQEELSAIGGPTGIVLSSTFMSKLPWISALLVVFLSGYCMPGFLRVVGRYYTTMTSKYVSGTLSMAFVTCPNEEVAKKLASGIVQNKLAACVNVIPGVKSIYEWEGKIEEDSELILMIKTKSSRVDELSEFVRKNHPFDVAEVISSPIDNGNPPYLKWIGEIVPESSSQVDAK